MPRPRQSLILALLLLTAACALQSAAVRPAPLADAAATETYEKAEAYYRNNFMQKAMATYLLVFENWPRSREAPASLARLGAIYRKMNATDKALYYYDLLVSQYPESAPALETHLQIGECRRELGQHEQAVIALSYYLNVSGAKRPDEARLLLADSLETLKKWNDALLSYAVASVHADRDGQVEILKKARRIVDEELQPTDLLSLIPRLADSVIADFVRFRAAQWLVEANRRPEAAKLLRDMNFTKRSYKFYEKAQQLLEIADAQTPRSLPSSTLLPPPSAPPSPPASTGPERVADAALPLAPVAEAPQHSVGVILTLSGPEAAFGQEVLQGVMQGVELFGPGGGAFQAVVRDDHGDPDTAAKLVDELADDPNVLAIVGPLLGKCAEKAIAEAETRGVPLIALTARENVLGPGKWAFRNFLTPSAEVRTLIQYATARQGAFRFAILYPETNAGRTYRDLFARSLDPAHYRLVAAVGYSPGATDFKQPIAQLQAHGSFDALFLPDDARQIALLAPQLVYYGVNNVLLLGPNAWNNEDLPKTAGRYLTRAVFVDAFFARSHANSEVEPFVRRYDESFHHPPNILAAAGYDTARVLAKALAARDIDREGLRRDLLRVRDFPGVMGELTFGENRDVDRRLFLLRFGGGQIEELP